MISPCFVWSTGETTHDDCNKLVQKIVRALDRQNSMSERFYNGNSFSNADINRFDDAVFCNCFVSIA